eukprot:11527255-Alexandrium_andersonii.AAC.1
MEDAANAWTQTTLLAGSLATWGARAVTQCDELEFIGRPCRCGAGRSSVPGHVIAGAVRVGLDGWRLTAPTVGLTAAPGQHVVRVLAHDGPAKDAIGAMEALRGRWTGRHT